MKIKFAYGLARSEKYKIEIIKGTDRFKWIAKIYKITMKKAL